MSARVTKTSGALYSVPRVSKRRRRCDGHLTERHWIEKGDLVVWSSLPPDNPEIGNEGWWHAAFCVATCAPADTLPTPTQGETR